MKHQEVPQYGNWVPERLLTLLWSLTGVCTVLFLLELLLWHNTALTVIFGIGAGVLLFYAAFMHLMHQRFSFTGGGLMAQVHEHLLSRLPWDGQGTLLDIGCGSGALTIRCAKTFPQSQAIGLDYWGVIWDYAEAQCNRNADLEGVKNVRFQKGDAAKLPFPDGSMDAAVSNFVFHEVRTVRDKRTLVIEALRVVKKGGSFAFHDLFEQKNMYGDIGALIEDLRHSGISEIHYEPHTENLPFVPGSIRPMFKNMGILYGKK